MYLQTKTEAREMTLTEEKVSEYEDMFFIFANDSDGTIDRKGFDIVTNFFGIMLSAAEQRDIFSDLEEAKAEMNCKEFLAVMDVISEFGGGGGGGKVNLKEFREKMEARRREERSRQQTREAFGAFDTDGGGDGLVVSEEELGHAVSRVEEGRGIDTILLADVDDDEEEDYLLHAAPWFDVTRHKRE